MGLAAEASAWDWEAGVPARAGAIVYDQSVEPHSPRDSTQHSIRHSREDGSGPRQPPHRCFIVAALFEMHAPGAECARRLRELVLALRHPLAVGVCC